MNTPMRVGVDGCRAGWISVARPAGGDCGVAVNASFAELIGALPADAVIAVDMPIGLPDRTGQGGRGPEALIRKRLGPRQSSVFSIPSRDAVYAEQGPFNDMASWYTAHRRASAIARTTSDPPRGCSIQAFGIFSRIREIDALLIARPDLRGRVFESHPEAAFWRLNGQQAMSLPKKIGGVVNPDGLEQRKILLAACGIARHVIDRPAPSGAAVDDLLDACAMLLIAERRAAGLAIPCPDPPLADSHGIPMAIWT